MKIRNYSEINYSNPGVDHDLPRGRRQGRNVFQCQSEPHNPQLWRRPHFSNPVNCVARPRDYQKEYMCLPRPPDYQKEHMCLPRPQIDLFQDASGRNILWQEKPVSTFSDRSLSRCEWEEYTLTRKASLHVLGSISFKLRVGGIYSDQKSQSHMTNG